MEVLHFFSDITPDCVCFAFYHQNDVLAIRNIFRDQSIDLEYVRSNYICVQEPLPGDIVVYANGVHYGIWKGDGIVLSKWGQGFLVEHRLEEVPLSYGETVLFYRKKENRLPFTREILAYLDEARTLGIKHPLLRSPLTAVGCGKHFYNFLQIVRRRRKKNCLPLVFMA